MFCRLIRNLKRTEQCCIQLKGWEWNHIIEYVQKLEAKIVAQEMILKELIVSPANLLDVEEEFKEKCQIYYNKKNLEIQTETNVVETTNEQN